MAVFWVVAPCSLVAVYRRLIRACCFHHLGDRPTRRRENLKSHEWIAYHRHNWCENFRIRYGPFLLSIKNFWIICHATIWVPRIQNVLGVTWYFIAITGSLYMFIASYFKHTSCLSIVKFGAIVTFKFVYLIFVLSVNKWAFICVFSKVFDVLNTSVTL
jgi:hypothetical protein